MFIHANLSGVRMARKIGGSNFHAADMRWAQFTKTQFVTVDLSYVNFENANLEDAWWARAWLNQAQLQGANMSKPYGWFAMDECGPVGATPCTFDAKFNSSTKLPNFSEEEALSVWKMQKINSF